MSPRKPNAGPLPLVLRLWKPLLFLACFGVYLLSLNPAFPNDDSAETITAAVTLGLQHPPGYALAALLMRLQSFLPLGSPSFRVNLFSALLASLAVCLLAWTLSFFLPAFAKKGAERKIIGFCAIVAPLVLAFSGTFWRNALGAKGGIYLLAACLCLAILGCLIRREAQPGQQSRWTFLVFFLTGLGLSSHWETQVILLPGLLVYFLFSVPRPFKMPDLVSPAVRVLAFLLIGASPILYLPLRAHLHPVLNLGAPDTWGHFTADLSRHYVAYREVGVLGILGHVFNGTSTWTQFFHLLDMIGRAQGSYLPVHIWADMGVISLMLALLGAWGWWRSGERKVFLFLLVSALTLLLALLSTLFIPDDPNQKWILDNFLLPLNWMTAFLAGLGILILASLLITPSRPVPSFLFILALVPCLMVVRGWASANQEKQTLAFDYGENLLKSLPRDAVFFAEGDEDYFPLYYLQQVAHQRPDVAMVPSFTLFEPWGVEQVERLHPELGFAASSLSFPDPFSRMAGAASLIVQKSRGQRACAFSYFNGAFHRYYLSSHPSLAFRKSGILYLFDSPFSQNSPTLALGGLRLRHWTDCPANSHPSLGGIWEVYGSAGLFNR